MQLCTNVVLVLVLFHATSTANQHLIITGRILPMCPKAPENLKGKVNISLEERKMEDIENDLGEKF